MSRTPKKKELKAKEIKPVLSAPKAEPKKTSGPQLLRGMKDILPAEQRYWDFIRERSAKLAGAYSFERIDTPVLEETKLFTRAVGKYTDIVEKEMFTFLDAGEESVTLRPEGTAPVVRAYINHGMLNLPQPVKLWYLGPMFRYGRPQSGSYRQFHQWGLEILGEAKPAADAELIFLAYTLCKELGLRVVVHINSLGHPGCREQYKNELVDYYKTKRSQICDDCKRRLLRNPLRVLDCKEEKCQPVKQGAPQMVDKLCDEDRNHFMKVLEFLDEIDLPYQLNPYLVRGLDYNTRTVFEIFAQNSDESISSSALGGGGRYDDLAELMGGRPTPGVGFALGIERLILALKEQNVNVPDPQPPFVYLAQLGDHAKRKALTLFEEIRAAGIPATVNFAKDSLKTQMELSAKLNVRYTIILGQKEVLDGTVILRDMDSGVQEVVDRKKIVDALKKKRAAESFDLNHKE
ncbi:histidine--tRNA ligase [Candidatus Uhrbacteria bacterium]|nr:histidine--tRNA ligase [Candidatus Uhrbacteria bacterium]